MGTEGVDERIAVPLPDIPKLFVKASGIATGGTRSCSTALSSNIMYQSNSKKRQGVDSNLSKLKSMTINDSLTTPRN